ncbi:MAG TPA: hypothetical protein VGS78_06970 [Candidatus Sulfotelmatobacter sp.]|nr:hypothetical protein [Candidatus Sulfotelmatobacter sp.]
MNMTNSNRSHGLRVAVRFWEPRRLWYSGILLAGVLGWVIFTWPHFRGSLGLFALWTVVFLALANAGYCAGYAADLFMQAFAPEARWRGIRWALWIVGTLFSMLVETYWIADEIYPYPASGQGAATAVMNGGGHFASNINFPAPLAVLGFLGACGGLFLATLAVLIFLFARKPKFARTVGITIGAGAAVYLALLVGFSAGSHSTMLALGQEKYFCEIDCHLAYSVADVKTSLEGGTTDYVVTLRTRFDEKTIAPNRPKDAPLMPSPREVQLIDRAGHEYAPVSSAGTALMTPLTPGESYQTELEFHVPKDAAGLQLLIRTMPAWPDHFVIGDENSWLHKKTYFAL